MTSRTSQKPPKHLKAATRRWFESVCGDYQLEPHHVRLLTLAGEAWDRCAQARAVIDKEGLTILDRFGVAKTRPEVSVERDSRIAFARLLRELALDVEGPGEEYGRPTPASLNGRGRR